MNRSNRAFTLIELIVVIGIMGILATLVIYGVRSMLTSSRGNSTKVILQNADAIYDEWRRATGIAGSSMTQPFPQAILPGSFDINDSNNFRAAKAVRLSRGFMFRMNQIPAIRKMISALPADRLQTFPDIDSVTYAAAMANLNNPATCECVWTRSYICIYSQPEPYYPVAVVPGATNAWPAFWLETNAQTPVFRDAWGNPLVMFPACGFIIGNELHTSQGVLPFAGGDPHWTIATNYRVGDYVTFAGADAVWGVYRCAINHTSSIVNAPNMGTFDWQQIPVRPFFASAGPDGVFFDSANPDTLKDNLYSFER